MPRNRNRNQKKRKNRNQRKAERQRALDRQRDIDNFLGVNMRKEIAEARRAIRAEEADRELARDEKQLGSGPKRGPGKRRRHTFDFEKGFDIEDFGDLLRD